MTNKIKTTVDNNKTIRTIGGRMLVFYHATERYDYGCKSLLQKTQDFKYYLPV